MAANQQQTNNNSMFNNPFMEYFKSFTENNMMNQNMSNFKMMNMNMDMSNMLGSQRRNAEMMTSMNQVFTENMHSIMRRSAEIMQNISSDMFQLMKDMSTSQNPEASTQKQINFAKHNFDQNVTNVKEIFEMMAKSNMEMFDLMSKNMCENFGEACQMAKKKAA